MTREKALDKIRKLLALAGSSNPHEAAAALRHAHALMRKHNIDDSAVAMSQVKQSSTTAARDTWPLWLAALMSVVAHTFGCKCYGGWQSNGRTEVNFIGIGAKPEIATYAFTVLRRQLTASRQRYYKTTRGKRANRIRRADDYAFAFVVAITEEVERFADQVPAIVEQAFLAIKEERGLVTEGRKLRPLDERAADAGFSDGKKVRLHTAVNGEEQRRLA